MMADAFSANLLTLAHWMAGDFSNQLQAFHDPQRFAHIHIFFRPLPFSFFDAIGFYSEQVYDYDLWSPYRQGVHRLVDQGNQVYVENYALLDPVRFAGAARELSILQTITPQVIHRRLHCSMVFTRHGESFSGAVEPGNHCLVYRQGTPSYLVSQVELTHDSWSSLDQGLDLSTHQQLWGSDFGPLHFQKIQSFAHELPPLS
jgi:CpeT protein